MIHDPIVKEVREAGAKLAAEAGHDVRRFFEKLREAEKKYGKLVVRESPAGYETAGKSKR